METLEPDSVCQPALVCLIYKMKISYKSGTAKLKTGRCEILEESKKRET